MTKKDNKTYEELLEQNLLMIRENQQLRGQTEEEKRRTTMAMMKIKLKTKRLSWRQSLLASKL